MSLTNGLAPRPPLGWNSYDCYGAGVTEGEIKATADAMKRELARFGWQYVVVDIRWYDPRTGIAGYEVPPADVIMKMCHGGALCRRRTAFRPAGGKGFKPLADYMHDRGLKFGIHIMRGIPRRAVEANTPVLGTNVRAQDIADTSSQCSWCEDMYGVDVSKPGGREYYRSLVETYTAWGVDYVKADDMASPYHAGEIEAVYDAADPLRPIVLSLSPGDSANTDHAEHAKAHSELWRITGDIWDSWKLIMRVLEAVRNGCLISTWPLARRGHAAAGAHRHPFARRRPPEHWRKALIYWTIRPKLWTSLLPQPSILCY